jgi:hypothetical protein
MPDQETHLIMKMQVLEETLDKMSILLCAVLGWVVANACFGILVVVGQGFIAGAIAGIILFGISFLMARGWLVTPKRGLR